MAEVKTIDVTGQNGSDNFPMNVNSVYDLIETICSQKIRAVKSANVLNDAFYFYDVENGSVIEEATIKMATAQALNSGTPTFAPKDPDLYVKYFNNWGTKQFKTTIRRNDIRKIIANKGVGVEDVVTQILDTLTQGEGAYTFSTGRNLILSAPVKDYSAIMGGVPSNMKGVIYAIRDMYNHLKANNSDCTSKSYVSSVPEADIRIALSTKLMNLIDVKELASIFNLEKEELWGKMVIIPEDDLDVTSWYKVVVYDLKAMGHGRRLFEFTQDVIGETLFSNHYLTIDDCWFYNGLFKAVALDVRAAATTDLATIIGAGTSYTVTNTLTNCDNENEATSIIQYQNYGGKLVPDTGYTMTGATVSITMGGTDITSTAYNTSTFEISIPSVTGNIVITATAA